MEDSARAGLAFRSVSPLRPEGLPAYPQLVKGRKSPLARARLSGAPKPAILDGWLRVYHTRKTAGGDVGRAHRAQLIVVGRYLHENLLHDAQQAPFRKDALSSEPSQARAYAARKPQTPNYPFISCFTRLRAAVECREAACG